MKVLSFRDIKLSGEFEGMNEVEMLAPSNDAKMNKVLAKIGIDLDYGVLYVPSKHRDMQGKVAVGFQAVGEIQHNRSFINSPFCTTADLIIVAGQHDMSLANELASLGSCSRSYGALLDTEAEGGGVPADEYTVEDDYEFVLKQIQQLTEVRDMLRGPCNSDTGSLKTPQEYAEYHAGISAGIAS